MNTSSVQSTVSVDTSSGSLVDVSPKRVAIIISAPPTNAVTISLEGTAVAGQGIVLYPTNEPLVLTKAQHGDIVNRAWTTIASTADTVGVIEVFEA